MFIGSRHIDQNNPTYFIADIAANHDGEINKAIDLIYSCAEAGANAAKFQHFKAQSIVSDFGFRSLGNKISSYPLLIKKPATTIRTIHNPGGINQM